MLLAEYSKEKKRIQGECFSFVHASMPSLCGFKMNCPDSVWLIHGIYWACVLCMACVLFDEPDFSNQSHPVYHVMSHMALLKLSLPT